MVSKTPQLETANEDAFLSHAEGAIESIPTISADAFLAGIDLPISLGNTFRIRYLLWLLAFQLPVKCGTQTLSTYSQAQLIMGCCCC
jgi:hypothetical protein